MHQSNLIPEHCMRRGQQLEIAEMGGQNHHTRFRIALFGPHEMVKTMVADTPLETLVKETAKPDIFSRGTPKIQIRRAQNPPAFIYAPMRKRNGQVAHPDAHVPAVERVAN